MLNLTLLPDRKDTSASETDEDLVDQEYASHDDEKEREMAVALYQVPNPNPNPNPNPSTLPGTNVVHPQAALSQKPHTAAYTE